MEKNLVLMSLLFDFYAGLLTEKQRDLFSLYYNEDLSLGEIAEGEGITRQGVRDAVTRAEAVLRDAEDRLGLIRRFAQRRERAERMAALAADILSENRQSVRSARIEEKAQALLSEARGLLEE